MADTLAKTTEPTTKSDRRPGDENVPDISPQSVKQAHATTFWREWRVQLPEGFETYDIPATGCWRRVQQNRPTSFLRHDRVYLVAADESWVATCIVTGATNDAVSLSKPLGGIIEMESRAGALDNDGTHRLEWRDGGFRVVRNSDDAPMTLPVQDLATARRELSNMYPRAVA